VGELSRFPADVQALIRHGVVPGGSLVPGSPDVPVIDRAFILDLDCYVETAMPCDSSQLSGHFLALHAQIDRFFRWSLTEEGSDFFGLEEKHDDVID
jgi:uncharacterized protein (TIGR04255 family)